MLALPRSCIEFINQHLTVCWPYLGLALSFKRELHMYLLKKKLLAAGMLQFTPNFLPLSFTHSVLAS